LLCKTVCNDFLCINKKESIAQDLRKLFKTENESIFSLSFVEKMEKLFETLVRKFAGNHAGMMEVELEDLPYEIYARAYFYFIEAFYLQEQPEALSKLFVLYKYYFKAFQDHFTQKNKNEAYFNKITFMEILKEKIRKDENVFLMEQPEKSIDNFSAEILAQGFAKHLSNNQREVLLETQLRVLKEYISFRIIQFTGFENPGKDFKECFSFYKDNQQIRDKISLELIPAIQKLILAYLLNAHILLDKPAPSHRLFELFCSKKQDLLYLDELINESGLAVSFDQFIATPLFYFAYGSDCEIIPFNPSLNIAYTKPKITVFSPTMINLPQNYKEFNTKYFRQKCSMCKEFSKHLLTCVCLICGDVLCAVSCDSNTKPVGNLNKHAKNYHMGTGIFLDFQQFFRSVIKAPLNTIHTGKDVYIDKLGQSIYSQLTTHRNVASLDFKKFVLNGEFVQDLKEVINNQSLGKEYFRVSVVSGNLYKNDYL